MTLNLLKGHWLHFILIFAKMEEMRVLSENPAPILASLGWYGADKKA